VEGGEGDDTSRHLPIFCSGLVPHFLISRSSASLVMRNSPVSSPMAAHRWIIRARKRSALLIVPTLNGG